MKLKFKKERKKKAVSKSSVTPFKTLLINFEYMFSPRSDKIIRKYQYVWPSQHNCDNEIWSWSSRLVRAMTECSFIEVLSHEQMLLWQQLKNLQQATLLLVLLLVLTSPAVSQPVMLSLIITVSHDNTMQVIYQSAFKWFNEHSVVWNKASQVTKCSQKC